VIKSRRIRGMGHVAHIGNRRGAYRALVLRPDGKRTLGRPRCSWENNVNMYLQEVRWGVMD
jgi:hypothetical protein